jgi:DNA repair exonuclease SbcCD ATPase subunit
MSKRLIGAAAFLVTFKAADEKTDLRALIQQVIDELKAQEDVIEVLKANISEAGAKITNLSNQLVLAGQLQEQLDESNGQVKALRIQLTDLTDEVAEYESQLEELQKKSGGDTSGLQAQLDEAYDTIAELGRKLDLQEKTKSQEGILVEFDGKHKLLIGKKFNIKGTKYTAEEVSNTPEALAHLFTTGSHSLVDPVIEAN